MPGIPSDLASALSKLASAIRGKALVMFAILMIAGCVTETTGGFNVEKSEKQALIDYIRLATGYLEQGDLLNTKRHLANASEIDNNSSEVAAIWGLVYSREGEADLADQSFRKALRLDSMNSQARNNYAAFLFANNRFKDAYEQLEKVVEDTEYEARSQAFENLGFAALSLNQDGDAEYAFARALQLNPNQLRSSLELTELNLKKSNILQARAYYRNYLTLMQFYNLGHSARSLWVGIQLEAALGNTGNVVQYGTLLENNFKNTQEYPQYLKLLDTLEDD